MSDAGGTPPGGSDASGGPGWFQASDGKWYPPAAGNEPPTEAVTPPTEPMPAYRPPDGTATPQYTAAETTTEKKGMSAESKWLIVGFIVLAALGITGIVLAATDDDDTDTTTTTQPADSTTEDEDEDRDETPTTEPRATTTEPDTTEAPTTEAPTTEEPAATDTPTTEAP